MKQLKKANSELTLKVDRIPELLGPKIPDTHG